MTAFLPVCRYDDLLPERGAAALLGSRQVAVFRTFDGAVQRRGTAAAEQVDLVVGAPVRGHPHPHAGQGTRPVSRHALPTSTVPSTTRTG